MERNLFRTLERRFSQRIHNFQSHQTQWLVGWSLFGGILIIVGILFYQIIGILSLPFFVVAALGSWRYSYGTGQEMTKIIRSSRNIRKSGNQIVSRTIKVRGGLHRKVLEPPINVSLKAYQVPGVGRDNLGVHYFPPKDSDTTIILSDAWDAVSLDSDERFIRENQHAEMILDGITRSKHSIGITQGVTNRPLDITRSRAFRAGRGNPRMLAAGTSTFEGADVPKNKYEWLAKHATDLDQRRSLYSYDVMSFVALNVPRPEKWPKTPDGSLTKVDKNGEVVPLLTQKQQEQAPVVKMTERIERNLRTIGVKNVRACDMDSLRTFTRFAWDLNMEKWYDKLISNNPEFDVMTDENFWPWPEEVVSIGRDADGKSYIRMNDSFHRIYRAYRMDRRKVFPGEFMPMYSTGGFGYAFETGLTVSMSGDTFPIQRELDALNKFITAERGLKGKKLNDPSRYVSQQERDDYRASEERQNRLYNSGATTDGLYWNTWVNPSATSLAALSVADQAVDHHATRLGVILKPVPFEALQIPALFTAVIGASMM